MKNLEPGDRFTSKAYGVTWYSVQGMNGIVHHYKTKEEQQEQAKRYIEGKVLHGLMELGGSS